MGDRLLDYYDRLLCTGEFVRSNRRRNWPSIRGFAYDQRKCYQAIDARGATATIPPQKNAKKWSDIDGDRNRNISRIEEIGRKEWFEESGYHRRSISETTMFRVKAVFGGKLSSRDFDNQAVELFVKCLLLNKMIQVVKPDSYIVNNS